MKQYVKKHILLLHIGQSQKMLKNSQVSGTGYGKKFRNSLDQTEDDRL